MTALIEETFYQELLYETSFAISHADFPFPRCSKIQRSWWNCAVFRRSGRSKKSSLSPHSPMQSVSSASKPSSVYWKSWTATAGAARFFISPPHHSQSKEGAFAPLLFISSSSPQLPRGKSLLCITSSVCIPDRHTPPGFSSGRPAISWAWAKKDADIIGCLVLVAGIQRRFQRLESAVGRVQLQNALRLDAHLRLNGLHVFFHFKADAAFGRQAHRVVDQLLGQPRL